MSGVNRIISAKIAKEGKKKGKASLNRFEPKNFEREMEAIHPKKRPAKRK
jgi:hypothetical protein